MLDEAQRSGDLFRICRLCRANEGVRALGQGALDERRGDVERTETSVDTIIRETEWLEAMIERVLTWRAAARDRFDLDMVSETMGPVMNEVAARFRRMLPPGEVDFAVHIDSQIPVLHDEHGVEILVLNLLTNAYKYTGPDKRITLDVTDKEDTVIIVVGDNGVGIPEREHGRIFDPFYRVESSRSIKASGAGLGLAIVRHMAAAHQGQVFVESAPGEGSRFVIHLPEGVEEEVS